MCKIKQQKLAPNQFQIKCSLCKYFNLSKSIALRIVIFIIYCQFINIKRKIHKKRCVFLFSSDYVLKWDVVLVSSSDARQSYVGIINSVLVTDQRKILIRWLIRIRNKYLKCKCENTRRHAINIFEPYSWSSAVGTCLFLLISLKYIKWISPKHRQTLE